MEFKEDQKHAMTEEKEDVILLAQDQIQILAVVEDQLLQ